MTKASLIVGATALLVLAVRAPGQKWLIPERGVVFYKRTAKLDGELPGRPNVLMPPVLLEGELDGRKRYVIRTPSNPRELLMWLAFDVRRWDKKGRIKAEIAYIEPFGQLRFVGTTSAVDDMGRQSIAVKVSRQPPERGTEFKTVFANHHRKRTNFDLAAEITIDRRFDATRGVVTDFKGSFFGTTQQLPGGDGKIGPRREFAYSEHWRLDRVAANRYRGFTTAVKHAIVQGSERIRRMIANPDGGQVKDSEGNGRTPNSGKLALALLTLLKSDVDPSDEVVARGFDSLRRRIIKGAYECGAALMAMEALYAPPNERQLIIGGHLDRPQPRKPTPEDLELMKEWTRNILSYTDARVKNLAYYRRFNYVAGAGRYDNSVTQYCVLGLYSAHLCGVDISPTVWFAISKHMLKDQYTVEGRKIALQLVSQRKFERLRAELEKGARGTRTVSSSRLVAPAGWPYNGPIEKDAAGRREPNRPLTGSMTVAGISNLTICDAVLRSAKKGGVLLSDMRQATRGGFAWLLKNFTVRDNPNFHGIRYYYYLYGLERAAELAHVALIGERDWYFEGATMLIGLQKRNGSWTGALEQNCFAVLFLKQAAPPLPVITGR